MTGPVSSAAIFALYWSLGALLLRRFLPSARVLSASEPHWLAAYPLGLVCNLVAAFALNQFGGLALTPATLAVLAVAALALVAALPQRAGGAGEAPRSEPWSPLEMGLALAAVALLAARHVIDGPLSDWDSIMYHLPLGDGMRDGHFPAEIGRSYIRQYEAAFPPMLYFQYALFPAEASVVAPRLFALLVDAGLCWLVAHVARRLLLAARAAALLGALAWAAVANVAPDTQSLTALYFLLTLVYGVRAFAPVARRAYGSGVPIVVLLGAGCYWNSYLGAGLLAVLYPAFASRAVVERVRGRSIGFAWSAWIGAAVATVALLVPHLLRNTLVTGNPLYPAFVEVLGGHDITPWFLENRPAAGTALTNPWGLLPLSFAYWRPWPQLMACGFSAALLARPLAPLRRAELLTLIGGFFLVWMTIYQRDNTPLDRFLFPIATLAVAALALHLGRLARMANRRAALQAAYLLPLAATALPDFDFLREGGIGAVPFAAWLAVWTVGLWAVDARFGARLDGPPVFAWPRGTRAFSLPGAGGLAALTLVAATIMALASHWPEANRFRAPIADDIAWLNENLDEGDTVLLFDGRIYGLERRFVAADDLRLEGFAKAPSPRAARAELARLGITHFYFSREASNGLAPSFPRGFFMPNERGKRVKLRYESPTGWVVELREPRERPQSAAEGTGAP